MNYSPNVYPGLHVQYGITQGRTNPEGQRPISLGGPKEEKKPDTSRFSLTLPVSIAVMAAIYFFV